MTQPIIDDSNFPIVNFVMPEQIKDTETEQHIAAWQAILDKQQPYVLIFSGVELPKNSAAFFREYKKWNKRTRSQQEKYCCGAVRVETDEAKRKSLWRKAFRYLTSSAIPYPYRVVATQQEAQSQATSWLKQNE
ncbi:hypothetical protein [Acinetobacter puyangensis]|uniref:hypothetical protein n=1 Tax=Acinetobacter puyangensis TaxID=1096779 RepID=UPI003A4DE7AD